MMAAYNAAPVETVHDKLRMHACVAGHAGSQYSSHETQWGHAVSTFLREAL